MTEMCQWKKEQKWGVK